MIVEFEWQPSVSPVQLSTEQLRTSLSLLGRRSGRSQFRRCLQQSGIGRYAGELDETIHITLKGVGAPGHGGVTLLFAGFNVAVKTSYFGPPSTAVWEMLRMGRHQANISAGSRSCRNPPRRTKTSGLGSRPSRTPARTLSPTLTLFPRASASSSPGRPTQ